MQADEIRPHVSDDRLVEMTADLHGTRRLRRYQDVVKMADGELSRRPNIVAAYCRLNKCHQRVPSPKRISRPALIETLCIDDMLQVPIV